MKDSRFRGIPLLGAHRQKQVRAAGALTALAVLAGVLFYVATISQAAPGDIAIYRETTGLETITTVDQVLDWSLTVSEGTGFSIGGSNQDITLAEAGHYLALYNVGYESTGGSNRSEMQTYLELEGLAQSTGRASCYIRRGEGTDECWLHGAAILEATSTDHVLRVHTFRTDDNAAGVRRRANDSALTLLRLDDNWDFARISESGGGQAFTTTSFVTVDWDTDEELDGAYSRTGGDITLAEEGYYMVTANVMFRNSSNARRNINMRFVLDGYEIPGTRTSAYMRSTNSTQDHVATWVGIIEATTTNQVLNVQAACEGEQCGSVTNVGGESAITIAKLPNTAQFVRLTETAGGQAVDATDDPITWDTQVELNSLGFSHSTTTNSSRITLQEDDDYLFFGSFFNDRTTAGLDQRHYPHWEWAVNGTKLQYGSFGKYNRGDQASTGTFTSGNAGGVILHNALGGDYIELQNTNEATAPDALDVFVGERMGIQGVRISTLLVQDASVSALGAQVATTTFPSTNVYAGGAFVVRANKENETLTDITLTESGTTNGQTHIENIRLYYETDTSAPYSCASESYDGTETQFGATSSSFSAADGIAQFSGSVAFGTTTSVCLYAVYDVKPNANDSDTLIIGIANPYTDVELASGAADPIELPVRPSGSTLLSDDVITQTRYHWRLDDDSEAAASSATVGVENTLLSPLSINSPRRLRLAVSNEGTATSAAHFLRLEFAERVTSCDVATGWIDVNAANDAWNLYDSTNILEGEHTTNIAEALGGVTDDETVFKTPNGGVRDTTSQTGSLTFAPDEFAELEYSIVATASSTDGATYCFRVTDLGTPLAGYTAYAEATIAADVQVLDNGTQVSAVDASSTDNYLGGSFVFQENTASRTVESIVITETGTIDAQNDLSNIRLYYELDTLNPYNCLSETYDGTEAQYGATSTSFSAANGSSTFSGAVDIATTSAMCVYVVADVASTANDGDTIDIEISNPGTESQVSSGSVNPNIPVAISGDTTVRKAVLEQTHFHWRNDDGSETTASSLTGGVEDTAISNVLKNDIKRLRLSVSNEGATSSREVGYTLEYGVRDTSCAAVDSWVTVGDSGSHWSMVNSANLTDGTHTTDIPEADGGVTNENGDFLTPNGGVRDVFASTSPLVLTETEFAEFEFAIEATTDALFATTYCFRLSDQGAPLDSYVYAQATTRPDQDFFVQRGVTTLSGTTTATIQAGVDYVAPNASTSAFIRITNTHYTGAGRDSLGGGQNANTVTTYIVDPWNIEDSVTFERESLSLNTRVAWEIVEYVGPTGGDNEIVVHAAETNYWASGNTTETVSVSGVVDDDDDVVVFVTAQGNPDTSAGNYNRGLVTADWDSALDEVVLERNESGTAVQTSLAVVEFTGPNWRTQRIEHTYGTAGSTEFETIPPGDELQDIDKAFMHVQKRSSVPGLDEYGHQVWLTGINQVAFFITALADSPAGQTSVAWIIENTQANGKPMIVTRSSGSQSGGSEPGIVQVGIGTTTRSLDTTSIFINNSTTGNGTAYPRPMVSARILSTTTYEIWISDTGQTNSYRTEIVDWPTAELTIRQNYYRFFVDNDALDPTDPWPVGVTNLGENAAITVTDEPLSQGDRIRVRMSLAVSGASVSAGAKQFALEYGARDTSCSAVSEWLAVGDPASTTPAWRGYNATPLDGAVLSGDPPTLGDLNLSLSSVAGSYEESNPSAVNAYKVFIGDYIEYDWILEAHLVEDLTAYCFRMVESSGALLDEYVYYPTIRTSGFTVEQYNWQWFGDETSITPLSALAASNTAPTNVAQGDSIKLRVTLEEISGKDGNNTKYKLQYSEYPDFRDATDVVSKDECVEGSLWCYADGAGEDTATITAAVLPDADSCVGGVGEGCGTHNEYPFTPLPIGEVGTTSVDFGGATIPLQNTYIDPVVILETITGDNSGTATNRPAAAMITATSTNSFDVRIQEPDNEADDHGNEEVGYLVLERGVYQLPGGTRLEANSKSTTGYFGSGVAGGSDDTCTYSQTFSDVPVVLTALQTNNNAGTPDFLTASQLLITSTDFACSIEVPDSETNAPGSPETYGWAAFDQSLFMNNGISFEASSTAADVFGWTNTPWTTYTFGTLFGTVPGIVASKQDRIGADGGWVRYDALGTETIDWGIDERDDGERSHTFEPVGYLAFDKSGSIIDEGTSDFTFTANARKEFEFTIKHQQARASTAYFFRLYDETNNLVVPLNASSTNPSLVTESGTLTFTILGLENATSTEGVTTDVTTTATSVPFGALSIGADTVAAHRLRVSTNATDGYRIYLFERQELTSGDASFVDISGTNAAPTDWSSGCVGVSCYGYHVGDDTLSGGSTRFLLDDTYAALTGTLAEIAYSSTPVIDEEVDIIYRVEATLDQPPGYYSSDIVYIAVPVF